MSIVPALRKALDSHPVPLIADCLLFKGMMMKGRTAIATQQLFYIKTTADTAVHYGAMFDGLFIDDGTDAVIDWCGAHTDMPRKTAQDEQRAALAAPDLIRLRAH